MKILLATDGSSDSDAAASFLGRLRLTAGDEVVVLHVVSDIPFMDDTESYAISLGQVKREIAPRILDSTVEKLRGIPAAVTTAVLDGDPATVIAEAAHDSGCGLIVLGSRGLRGISSLLLGSVARSVSIRSTLPVLVIRPSAGETGERLRIAYATDGSEEAMETGRLLTTLPLPADAEVTVITVITSGHKDIPERYWMEVNEQIKDELSSMRERELAVADRIVMSAMEILRKKFSRLDASILVGDPALEIIHGAKELGAHIIAVGSRGLRGVRGMMGSVSRSVLGHSDCPVLIGKSQKEPQ